MRVLIRETGGYNRNMTIPNELPIYHNGSIVGNCIHNGGSHYKITNPHHYNWEWVGAILDIDILDIDKNLLDKSFHFYFNIETPYGSGIRGLNIITNLLMDFPLLSSDYNILGDICG